MRTVVSSTNIMLRPNKKKPEIPITLPTLNYPATLFYIFIFIQIYVNFDKIMLIYANFYSIMLIYTNFYLSMLIYAIFFLIMQIYEHFMNIFMKLFDKAKKP